MCSAFFGFNEWWFEILLPYYWLEVVGLFSSDLWHHLVCKWSIYTHFIYFSFVFGTGSYSNVRILISVCFPFTVRVTLRDWIWADFGCMHEKSWSQFWKIQLLSHGFLFIFLYLPASVAGSGNGKFFVWMFSLSMPQTLKNWLLAHNAKYTHICRHILRFLSFSGLKTTIADKNK